jgi:dolichol-phosphate mannosyltransferase
MKQDQKEDSMLSQGDGNGGARGPRLSLVAPVYNEVNTVREFVERATSTLDDLNDEYEIVLVDDGSTDGTGNLLKELHGEYETLDVIRFSRNFGHHVALTAGLDYAKGQIVVMMDSDLQDRPEDIPKLVQKLREGYDVVTGVRVNKKDSLMKRCLSWGYHKLMQSVFRGDFRGENFRVCRRKVIEAVRKCRESERLVDGLIEWAGFTAARVEVEHAERHAGESKYSFVSQLKLALNSLTSFTIVPLQFVSLVGLLFSLLSFVAIAYLVFRRLYLGLGIPGWSSLMVTITFMGGLQMLCLGIIGEYVGRIAIDTRDRPLYIVTERLAPRSLERGTTESSNLEQSQTVDGLGGERVASRRFGQKDD